VEIIEKSHPNDVKSLPLVIQSSGITNNSTSGRFVKFCPKALITYIFIMEE